MADRQANPGSTTSAANANRETEVFDPPYEWTKEGGVDNLLVFLPGKYYCSLFAVLVIS